MFLRTLKVKVIDFSIQINVLAGRECHKSHSAGGALKITLSITKSCQNIPTLSPSESIPQIRRHRSWLDLVEFGWTLMWRIFNRFWEIEINNARLRCEILWLSVKRKNKIFSEMAVDWQKVVDLWSETIYWRIATDRDRSWRDAKNVIICGFLEDEIKLELTIFLV